MRRLLSTTILVMLAGCVTEEHEDQVKDLRILAIRAEPPELLYSIYFSLPPEQRPPGWEFARLGVRVEALVVDPQGRESVLTTRFCPEQRDDGCPGYRVRDDAPREQILELVPLVQPRASTRTADVGLAGEARHPSQLFAFGALAMDYMLPRDASGALEPSSFLHPFMPSAVLRVATRDGAESEVAFKRVQLNVEIAPDTWPSPVRSNVDRAFKSLLGVGLCPPGIADDDEEAECVKERRVNRNPRLVRVLFKRGAEFQTGFPGEDPTSGGQFADVIGRISVHPGEELRLRPVVADDDRQHYQQFEIDSISGRLRLRNRQEDFVFLWFTTAGTTRRVSSDSASVVVSGRPEGIDPNVVASGRGRADSVYIVSPDAPDGPASVWLVVQDQRGGVDWQRIDFMTEGRAPPDEDGLPDLPFIPL